MNQTDAPSFSTPAPQAAEPSREPARRVRRSPEQKAELITRFEASGLKVGEFCRREGLSEASFYLWRRDAGRINEPATPARLLRVETGGTGAPASQPDAGSVTARLRNGVEVCTGFEHLEALVKAVASC